MKFIIFFICVPLVYSELHEFISTYTEINGKTIAGIPEIFAVTTLDGQQIYYYDSNIKKLIPKQDWMKEFASEELWKKYMEIREKQQQIYKINIHVIMETFNQSQGVHTYQRTYGCEWDDETGDSHGFDEYGYDGEDFIALDLKENRYNASVPQATTTVEKWNKDREQLTFLKQYYDYECVYWLKEFLTLRKEAPRIRAPEVSLLQKHTSSPVECHATGFYPSGVIITWFRNGHEHEDVDLGETLPNEDGTFQKSSTLRVSPDEWKNNKFSCKVEQQGKTIRKTENEIKTPEVSLLQKDSSSPVECHATGFYPSGVSIIWFRNGQEHEDVDLGELLPNEDETFQKSSSLRVSPDEWKNYQFSCEVEHQGKTIRKILTEDEIKRLPTLWTKQGFPSAASHLTKTYPSIHVLLCVMGVFIFAL